MKTEIRKYCCLALDPIHVGAGGYRLGRADNTIVREPATGVPKLPGTSIAGTMREYYRIHLKENGKDEQKVIDVFGDENRRGRVRFYDGQILFFPVPSQEGTIWVTTPELLEYWLDIKLDSEDQVTAIHGLDSEHINLGWLYFKSRKDVRELPSMISERWVKRAVSVPDSLFSQIVNDNLEVRTSVRIDPETGTAKSGALFTYEAIPRGTILAFEMGFEEEFEVENILPYFRYMGIGGMGTRGFGRMEIRELKEDAEP